MRLPLLFIATVLGAVPPEPIRVPVRVLYRSPSMETQATTQAPKYDRMSKEALQIIEDTYLANRDVRRGLWPLCAEALHKQNIYINENDGQNRLSIIRRKYGDAREYTPMPHDQEQVLAQARSGGVRSVVKLHELLQLRFGERAVNENSVRNWCARRRQSFTYRRSWNGQIMKQRRST